ncbi:hypothetical protein [Nocardiopsis ansamitocini]|uniref:Uncharacterized protein n=1 Tax=Nocardiopsis ansamitocini TaxID=1670832 RepID=A0A9W6P9I3_9ACTN|nr:hypothetical protein [Nocardiopsis ansamitocini]GLU49601.1 hypothetical protein Nans01_39520 [Nocardiopsis ansamitocini]
MLRHPLGLLVGLFITPLLWSGAAWSTAEIGSHLQNQQFSDPLLLTACATMMGVGLAAGLLAGSRISPLAAFLPGVSMLGGSLWALLNYPSMAAVLPSWFEPGSLFHPLGPGLPVFLGVGTLLFISALIPSRWRSARRTEEAPMPYAPAPEPAAPPVVEATPDYDYSAPPEREEPQPLPRRRWTPKPARPRYADDRYTAGSDDPTRTTTPFRRSEDGFEAVEPKGEEHTRTFRDG